MLMWDQIFAAVLLAAAVVWMVLAAVHELRQARHQDWEAHVTSAPGLGAPASDWDAWADELKGWA